MTYETGTASSVADLLSKLSTFAVTTHGGWTAGYSPNPNTTNGWFELHKGNLSFGAKYVPGGTAEHIGIHQAAGYVGTGTAPGKHTADSGNGYNAADTGFSNANIQTERCVRDCGDGPFPSYHFFADDVDQDYVYVVLEISAGTFRHFGFGILDLIGDGWVGGEFTFGHYHDSSSTAIAVDADHQTLLDGLGQAGGAPRAATIRIAIGLPNQSPAVWGVALRSASVGTDTAGKVRRQIHGGFRAGLEARGFGNVNGSKASGVVPMMNVSAYYSDPSNPTRKYLLGYLPDVRWLNISNFGNAEEIAYGGDTWVIFPMSQKTSASVAGRSLNLGIAYRKVV